MKERSTEVKLFGQTAILRYSERWFGLSILAARLLLGWVFFYSGITKLLDPAWSAGPFLRTTAGAEANPFASVWLTLAEEWLWLVDPLNEWGLTLIGLSLLFGALVRIGSLFGVILLSLYYAANLPLEWGFVVDFHIIYILLLFGIAAVGAGRLIGLDYYLENNLDLPSSWARYALG